MKQKQFSVKHELVAMVQRNYYAYCTGVARGPWPLTFLAYIVILCFERSQTKWCYSLKIKHFDPPKILG